MNRFLISVFVVSLFAAAPLEIKASDGKRHSDAKLSYENLFKKSMLPTITTFAMDEIVECDGNGNLAQLTVWLGTNGGATANAGTGSLTWSNTLLSVNAGCGESLTANYEFFATDDDGTISAGTASFIIRDTNAPMLGMAGPTNQTVECDGSGNTGQLTTWLATNGGFSAADACSTTLTWSNALTGTAVDCGGAVTLTFRFTVADECGNSSIAGSANFIIEDTTNPAINCPASTTIECGTDSSPATLGTASGTDLCSGITSTTFSDASLVGGTCPIMETITRTWMVTDGCSHTNTCDQIITIEDTTAPVITIVPQDMTVECDSTLILSGSGSKRVFMTNLEALNGWLANNGGAEATDACSNNLFWNANQIDGISGCGITGEYEFEFFVEDPCGNSVSAGKASFFIVDTQGPAITGLPRDTTVACDGAGNMAQLTAWRMNNAGATAMEGCSDPSVWTNNIVSSTTGCAGTLSHTYEFTVTDACGNATVAGNATFTVIDDTAPTWTTAPVNETVECNGTGNGTALSNWITASTNPANVTDACGSFTISTTLINFRSGLCPGESVATYQFTATDDCGNSASETADFIIDDSVSPSISCPPGLTISCNDDTSPNVQGFATATDACGISGSPSYTDATVAGTCPTLETVTRTWSIADDCGNISTCNQVFVVQDNSIPTVLVASKNMTVECDGTGNTAALVAWRDNNGGGLATDACSSLTYSFVENSVPNPLLCPGTGCYNYTFSATDNCNNTVVLGTVDFCIENNNAPQFSAQAISTTVECNGTGNTTELNNWLTANGGATATDVCDGSLNWTATALDTIENCGMTLVYQYQFAVADDCGNTSVTNADFTIVDTTAPVWVNAPDIDDEECDGSGNVTGLASFIAAWENLSNVSEACGTAMITPNLISITTADNCPNLIEYKYEFTATDQCGNMSTNEAFFNIYDLTPPTITCPGNVTITCSADGSPNNHGFATATDVCSNTPTITYADVDVVTNSCLTTKTRTWTATDDCNNASTCDQTIIIEDTEDPVVITAPQNMTVECDGTQILYGSGSKGMLGTNAEDLNAWLDTAGDAVVSDDCGNGVTFSSNLMNTVNGCGGTVFYVYEFFATDGCTNQVSIGLGTFTVEDTQGPTVLTSPLDTVVNCAAAAATAVDLATWLNNNGGATASDPCSITLTWMATVLSTTSTCPGDTTKLYQFEVADDCGNSTIAGNASFRINDNSAPVWDAGLVSGDSLVNCDGSGNTADLATWLGNWTDATNAPDACGTTVITANQTNIVTGTCPNLSVATYVFTASDGCGNTDTRSATFTIQDINNPTITCPTNATITCSDDASPNGQGFATGTDVCSPTVAITYADADVITSACLTTKTRTWTATDDCNRTMTCNQTIIIEDTEAPVVITAPQNMTVECDGTQLLYGSGSKGMLGTNAEDLNAWLDTAGDAVVSDDCGNGVTLSANLTNTVNGCGGTVVYTYEFFATDACTNQVSIGFATFTVEDTQAPTVLTIPLDTIVNCAAAAVTAVDLSTWLGNNGGSTASDPCSNMLTWTATLLNTTSTCANDETRVYQFEVEDLCGNKTVAGNASFTINDNTAPVWNDGLPLPGNELVNCDGAGNATDLSTWLGSWTTSTNAPDACGTTTITSNQTNIVTGNCPNISVATYVFTASDQCGNTDTRSATFTIQDISNPTITCPGNATITCSDDASPNGQGFATGTDVCTPTVAITYADADVVTSTCLTTKTRTWTATDDCNRTMTCNQTIIIEDTEAPVVITAPQNMTVECDGTQLLYGSGSKGMLGTNAEDLNAWLDTAGDAVVSDDCGNGVTLSANLTNTVNGCGGTVVYTYEFFATDACTNQVSIGFATFTVEDTQAPTVLTIPLDTVVNCAAAAVTAADLATWLGNNGGSTASDPCSNMLTWTATLLNTTSTCANDETRVYQFEVEDLCGNKTVVGNASFTINDNTAPIWNDGLPLPGNTTASCDGNGNTAALATWIGLWETATNAPDACGTTTITSELSNLTGGTCPIVSVATYIFTASDQCGNTSTRSATFTINDTVIPTITCPGAATIACTADSSPNALGFATGTDVCSTPGIPTYVDVSAAGTCPTLETITRTWTIADNCGNTNTCDQTITVQDNAVPTIVANPQDETVECDGSGNLTERDAWLASNGFAIVTDDCGTVTFSNNLITSPSGCSGTGCYRYSFAAQDGCGNNVNLGTADFCIEDTNAPTITMAATDLNVSCDGSATAAIDAWTTANGNATATDGCGAIVWSFSILTANPTCTAGAYTTTYQFTATDACGNASNTTANLNITDTDAPTWIATLSLPGNETAECDGSGNLAEISTWLSDWIDPTNVSDDCSAVTISTALTNFTPGACPGNSVSTYEFTATDVCGNASTRTATFTINDTAMPTINCPANAIVECADDYSPGTLGFPSGSDACGNLDSPTFNDVAAAGACPLVETVTRTWTIADECGNTSTCDQIITRQDTEVPTLILAPQTTFVECDGGGNAAELAVWLADAAGALASDDCGTVTYDSSVGVTTADCGSTGCTTYTFTATDLCGNILNLGNADFCIEDTSIPQITGAAETEIVECDGGGNTAALTAYLTANGNATTTDFCGSVTWSNSILQTLNTCGSTSEVTYQFTATDECSNVAVTTGKFIIEDSNGPTWVSPQGNRAVECDGNGNTTQLSNWIALWETSTNATDVCGSVTIISQLFDFQGGTCPVVSVSTYQFSATDECGNTTTQSATFTINDSTIPAISCPGGTTIACTDDSSPNALGFATGTDVCSTPGIPTYADVSVAGTCPTLETITRTWTISDDCGNTNTCNQVIVVQDNAVPVIVANPQNRTVECDGSGNTTEFNNWLTNNGFAIVTDDCGTVNFSNTRTAMPSGCSNTGCYTYSFTAEDGCGNILNLGNANFCIEDTNAPTITLAASDLNVSCDGSATAAVNAWTTANGNATAVDGCGAITWSFSILTTNPSCVANAVTTVYQFTATDACGNATNTTANLNITDNDAPNWIAAVSLPGDETVECNGAGNTGDLTTWLNDWTLASNVSDDCSAVTISTALTNFITGACPGNTTATYEFTATDVCGNASTRTATFTIEDTAMPTINCPANATVECADDYSPGTLGFPSGNDACGNLDSPTFSDVSVAGACPLVATVTRTWTMADECGNTATCDQIIMRRDTEVPTLVLAPQTTFVECDGAGNAAELTVWLDDAGDALATDDCGTVTYSAVAGASTNPCGSTGCTTYTFSATDLCGNILNMGDAQFCIEDTTIPQISQAAESVIVECDGGGNTGALGIYLAANGNAMATDACDGTLTWSNSILNTINNCGGTSATTYQFTATDDCGNVAVTTGTFIIEDSTGPTWDSPQGNLAVECDGNGNTTQLANWIALWETSTNASDICGSVTISSQLFDLQGGTCPIVSVSTYQFIATDICGNTTTRSATFTINDSTIPTITCPSGTTIACMDDSSPNALGFATGSDVCGITGNPTYADVSVAGTCPTLATVTRTWTIADECGNTNTCDQTIILQDTEVPVIVSLPQNQTVECDGAGNTTAFNAWLSNNAFSIVTDDCGTVTYTPTQTAIPTGCSGTGCYTYSFMAEDGCGNTLNLGSADFCIQDTDAPMITSAASDFDVTCNGSATAAINLWTAANGNAVASDDCGNVTWSFSILTTNPSCVAGTYSTIYQFTATDDCGNAASTTANLNLTDNSAPTWIVGTPTDVIAECDGSGNTAELAAWIALWETPSNVSDDCSSVTISSSLMTFTPGSCPGNSVAVYEFEATDLCGNIATRQGSFTIEDTTIPSITCPAGATVNCSDDFTPGTLGFPSGNDNCGNLDSPTFSDATVVALPVDCPLLETITRTWTLSDECGNVNTCDQIIIRRDTEDPVLVAAPQNLTVDCDGAGNATELADWLTDAGDALASDDCSTITYSSSIATAMTDLCGSTGCTTYEFTATDGCGNALILGRADFCIEDNSAPQITSFAVNEIVECGSTNGTTLTNWLNANGNATATDVCDGTLAWSNAILSTTAGCGNTSTTTYQFTATDDCGNFSVTTADFIIEDNLAPTWNTLTGNESVECDGSGNTTAFNAWFGNWTNAANVTDACGGGTISINSNLIDNVDNCGGTSVRTYQFMAMDACGNVNIQTATFTINDTTAPTIACPTSPITIDCSEDASPATQGFATGTDVCGNATVTYSDVVVLSTVTLLDSITRTWVITDDCNNSNTCTQIIQRRDTEEPTVAATPQNMTVECDGSGNTGMFSTWIDDHADALAADDCSTITYDTTLISTFANPTCAGLNCVRYEFTATDGFGNSVTLGMANFCIEDSTNPQISTPATALTLDCDDSDFSTDSMAWVNANGNAVATDVCDTDLTWSASILQTTAGCGNTSTATYQFTATDDCGNFSVTTADLIIQDVTAPIWSLNPGDSNLECDGTGNTAAFNFWFASWTNVANVTEGCGNATITSNLINNVDNCGGTSVRTFEFTATDECGNANLQTATFTINDTTAPTISCPTSPITIDCSEDASPATQGFATGTDICGNATVNYSDVVVLSTATLLDSITRTWIVTDDCSNADTCTQIIQRRDTENPTVAATPQNMTVECDGSGNTGMFSTWIDDHADALAADDCSTITYDTTLISTFANPTCTGLNCVRYEFTATDGFGNSVTLGMANFCIEDSTNPQISTPATALTLDCGDTDFSTDSLAWVNANGNAVVSDVCDNNLTWAASILQTTSGCGNTSTSTYQFTATDDCGNFSVTTADLIIQDVTAPVWSLNPGNSSLECDGSGNTAAYNFWLSSWTNPANVTEDCSNVTITSNLLNLVNGCGNTYTRTFEFTATDDCGNATIETATFAINDTGLPTLNCPASVIVDCDLDFGPNELGFATASDLCGTVNSPTYTDATAIGTCPTVEIIARTWTVVDECGNPSNCIQVINRRDNVAPTELVALQNMTVECDGSGNNTELLAWRDNHAGALAIDDCSTLIYSNTLVPGGFPTGCSGTGCWVFNFTAEDGCGNTLDFGNASFCIEDTTSPQITQTAISETVECGSGSVAALTSWLVANGNATATDVCDNNLTWTNRMLVSNNNCGNTFVTTYEFTATDACGNFSVTTADFVVEDNTAPVWAAVLPTNETVECDGSGNTAAFNTWFADWMDVGNVTEACGTATITSNLLNNVDNCGATSVRIFEFTATDECGNATAQTAIFTIEDTAAPTIACPTSPVTVDCNEDFSPTSLGFATGSDVCGNTTSAIFTDVIVNGSGTLLETITRTWSISDDCGNTSTCNQVIERRDTELPTIVAFAQDLTVECDGNGNFGAFSNWIDDHADALAADDCSTITYDTTLISTTASCGNFTCVRYEFTATDAVGNSVNLGQAAFCIEDTTSPEISTAATNLRLDCDAPNFSLDSLLWVNAHGNAVATDGCDFNLTWTTSILQRNLDCGNTSSTTYQFRATDDCGNFSVTTAELIVEDVTPPVWIAALPGNDTVDCDGSGNTGALIAWVNNWSAASNASDGCGNSTITSSLLGFANSGCFGTSISTYLFAASDECGNTSTQTATFTIIDTIAPTLTCPADRILTCTDDISPNALGFATGSDLCSNLPTITYADVDVTNVCQVLKTRIWTATDNCGNSATCDQVIELNDTEAPTLTRMPTVSNYEYFRDPTGACHANVTNPQGIDKGNGCWEMIFDLFDANGNPMGIAEFDGPCAVDDCGQLLTPVLSSSRVINNDCFSVWSASWRFEDDCGNFVDYDQTFTFVDQAAPLWTQANPLLLSASCTDDIDAVIAANIPTIEDNCAGAMVTEVNRFTLPGNCGSNFTQVVEYNATDACGNLNPIRYQVRIDMFDTTAPTWIATASLPGNQSIECDGAGNPTDLNDWLDDWKMISNATDVCGAVTITEQLLNFFPGQCNGTGIWNYQFTAEDPCGNTSIQNATFTIEDTTGPTISTCPTTVTVDCEDSIDPAVLGQPTATDVCNAVTGFTHSDVSTFPGCPGPLEQITRTWTALDACGNTSTCVQTINVTDGTVPTLLVTSNDQLILLNNVNGACSEESTGAGDPGIHLSSISANGPFCSQATFDAYDANGIYVESFTAPGPCAEDNCSAITFGHSVSMAQNGCDFVTTITWTMTDDCGNSITDVQVVTVRDMSPPAWVNQSTITVTADCGDDINALIAANAPTANDNCSVNYNVVSDNMVGGNCSSNYTRTITYSVSDDCGNTNPTNVDLVIILDDQSRPTFTVSPKDTTVECTGNDSLAIAIWLSDFADAQFADVCGTATITAFPSDTIAQCGGTANYEYSFVVADDCGNADTVTAMFMLIDTTAPVIVTAARDTTLSCELLGGNALNDWLATGGNAVATDNCLNPVFWENELLSTTANTCLPDTLHYRLMAVDSCGGRDTTEAMFILIDTIAPIFVGVPNDTIINCNGTVPSAASPTIMDCDANATMTFNETIVNVNANGILDSITRVWTATDCQSLVSRDTQIIIVKPTNAPTLTFCPADIGPIVSQGGQCVAVNWSAPIFSSNCSYTVTSTHNPGDCFPIGKTRVTYTATDDTGQTATCSFDVEVTEFCQPIVHASNTFHIHKFVFNGVESTTGDNGGYIDLTTISSTVQQGQNILLTLSPGFMGNSSSNAFGYWRVWIDWNGDGDFYDASELVIQLSGQGLIIAQTTIPSGATLGEKRIRVAFHHFGFLDPCDPIADQNGEMEDYTLFVLPQLKSIANDNTNAVKTENSIVQPEGDFGFAATPNGKNVDLKWVANNELETDRFVIERSKDGSNFTQLMTVENTGEGVGELFYKTKDKNPLTGESFYRLKQILTDGTVIQSEIQKVIFGQAEININFFPNPTSGVLNVEMPDFIGQSGRVTVMNQLSQSMMHFDLNSIEKLTQLDLNNLTDGVYFIRVEVGEVEVVEKVFLRR